MRKAQGSKNPPAMQETQEIWVQSLDREDPLEKEMATHTSVLAWRIPWTEEPGDFSPRGRRESDATERPSMWKHRRSSVPSLSLLHILANT